jgi:hypothetical protein
VGKSLEEIANMTITLVIVLIVMCIVGMGLFAFTLRASYRTSQSLALFGFLGTAWPYYLWTWPFLAFCLASGLLLGITTGIGVLMGWPAGVCIYAFFNARGKTMADFPKIPRRLRPSEVAYVELAEALDDGEETTM